MIDKVRGTVRIKSFSTVRETELLYEGKNTLTYRAKWIFSRLAGAGLNGSLQWGTSSYDMKVIGIAVGNGGHLIYNNSDESTTNLSKISGTIQLDSAAVTHDITRVAMPNIAAGQWGYSGQQDRFIPGPTYEEVENGNVPWDGITGGISDNSVGVVEPNTTLYSETARFPLDSTGVEYVSGNAVVFRATLPQTELNTNVAWGYANFDANVVSEIGLIVGDPTFTNHAPSVDVGLSGNTYYLYGDPNGGTLSLAAEKDEYSKPPSSFSSSSDTWTGTNTWNIIARSVFPGITKSSNFALVFEWVLEF